MDWASLISAGIQATSQAAQGILNYNENIKNRNLQKYINERNYQAQKEFYQNSISWRKQDAINAGINPIYALGGSSASFTPSFQMADYQPINVSKFGDIAQQFNAARQAQEQIELAKESAKTENKLNEARIATEEAKQAHYSAQTAKLLETEPNPVGTGKNNTKEGLNAKPDSVVKQINSVIKQITPAYEFAKTDENFYVLSPISQFHQEQLSEGVIDKWNFKLRGLQEFADILNEKGVAPKGYHYESQFDWRLLQQGLRLVKDKEKYKTPEPAGMPTYDQRF